MPASYSDQFYDFDPAVPPEAGTAVSAQQLSLTDQNDDGDIDSFDNDTVNGLDVEFSYPGDTVTILTPDGETITYTGTTFYLSDDSRVFTPTDGQLLKAGEFVSSTYVTVEGPLLVNQMGPPCFVAGTMISTPSGPVPIEALRPGDLVTTLDRGARPVVALRQRLLSAKDIQKEPRHAPVRLPAESFGGSGPDLLVSPQHRILLRSAVAERMLGHCEVLAPAAQLMGHAGIVRDVRSRAVSYVHLIFDHHAIVLANGVASESLLLTKNTLSPLGRDALVQLRGSMPAHCLVDMQPARPLISGKRLKTLLYRHKKNAKPLMSDQAATSLHTAS